MLLATLVLKLINMVLAIVTAVLACQNRKAVTRLNYELGTNLTTAKNVNETLSATAFIRR